MFNKTLISIFFLKGKVFIVQLTSAGNQIQKYASIEVPMDIIKDNKVQNVKALAEVLKGIWNKFDFKEKSVGLVVPEFSTFTKLLKLPKLGVGEVNEAINWEAQEYLPQSSEKMILDWKIVERGKSDTQVLIVSILKEVLMSYVEAIELAGLFPYAVETPSLALTNLTQDEADGLLIIYTLYGETVLIAAKKEKIYGTSVLSDSTNAEILQTGSKMISHFGDINIQKVLVGGFTNESFLGDAGKHFGLKTELLTAPVANIDASKLQEFLVPIAMQMKKISEPSDPKTLNLLPLNLVERYKNQKTRIQIWSLSLTITLFIWISFLMVLGSYFFISQQIAVIKEHNLANSSIERARIAYEQDAKKINEAANKVLAIKKSYVLPETILNHISVSTPQGVNLNSYKMDLERGSVAVIGTSPTRTALVVFKQNLEKVQEIKGVSIPISNFEKETNLEFELSFTYGQTVAPKASAPAR